MAIPGEREINAFLVKQIEYWNSGKRQEMTTLYRRYAEEQLVIEYVGEPLADGWQTYEHMWNTYSGKVRTDVVEVLINGNEAACYYRNVRVATGLANPSIETYHFENKRLHIRYFHKSHAGE